MLLIRARILLFVVGVIGITIHPTALAADGQPDLVARVLFIGNSLTAANDLPAMMAAIARVASTPAEFTYETVTLPDFGLQEHWEHGGALRAIRRGRWSHVVLQQGPSTLPESRCTLIEYAKKFVTAIRAAGAEPVFYSVWPSRDRLKYFDAGTESYAIAAALTGSSLAPAGAAWQRAWQRDPRLAFYGNDGFHPSKLGTYAAALVLLQTIAGREATGSAPEFINAAEASIVQEAASNAVADARRNKPSGPTGCR